MTQVGLLSDTHGYFDPILNELFVECNEIWHAGDIGNFEVWNQLNNLRKPLKAVYGNIDGKDIRYMAPLEQIWTVEEMKIYMIHIGGYPGKYAARIRQRLTEIKPDIFVCGHSHILKVMYDNNLQFLHLNPGACGYEGFHNVRTALRFRIDGHKVTDMQVLELGPRSLIKK